MFLFIVTLGLKVVTVCCTEILLCHFSSADCNFLIICLTCQNLDEVNCMFFISTQSLSKFVLYLIVLFQLVNFKRDGFVAKKVKSVRLAQCFHFLNFLHDQHLVC